MRNWNTITAIREILKEQIVGKCLLRVSKTFAFHSAYQRRHVRY